MPRWKLTLEYDGTPYQGWQSQDQGRGVQDALETAIMRLEGALRRTHAAGRTDAGVHATAQVVHVDLEKDWTAFKLREGINAFLRRAGHVSVLEAEAVDDRFHARFSAKGRSYLYRVADRRPVLALDTGRAWRVPYPLDLDLMQQAADRLLGTHDFTTFRDVECQANGPVRTLERFELTRVQTLFGEEIHARLAARSFLHRQVRSMMGSIKQVAAGHRPLSWISDILEARDRQRCGVVAPPWGLYLTGVDY
jgi:tRNA pseudouridine38-40 synthase